MSDLLAILGGGPAGLAAGYAAAASHPDFAVFEAAACPGGNCRTVAHGPFRFDTGAHRFHDKLPDATAIVRSLLGEELLEVTAPSRIAYRERYVDFPLSPLNALSSLGARQSCRAAADLVRARITARGAPGSFEDFALATYGRTIADAFLLGYSRKLWGRPCSVLSPDVAGARLRGLTVPALIAEAFRGRRGRARHLDGAFLYPRTGIGRLTDRLAEACGAARIRTDARVTRVFHDGARVTAVTVNGTGRIELSAAISTVPLDSLVTMLDPPPPAGVLDAARALHFRHVVLVVLLLDRPSITPNATVYFPDPALPFTRVYEPRNRSAAMSPEGRTSLVAEIPCDGGSPVWSGTDESAVASVREPLIQRGWIRDDDILGAHAHRIANAYPVLEIDTRARVAEIREYLRRFSNLELAGRVGQFAYSHLHEQMQQGCAAVASLLRH